MTITATSALRRRCPRQVPVSLRLVRSPACRRAVSISSRRSAPSTQAKRASARRATSNLAALHVVNAANIQAQGNVTGVPQVQAPNIGGLTEASNTAGAAQQAGAPKQGSGNAQPSIIIVEVLGFGGGEAPDRDEEERRRKSGGRQSYDPNSSIHLLGNGILAEGQRKKLTDEEQNNLELLISQRNSP